MASNQRIDPELESQLGLSGSASAGRARRKWVRRLAWALLAVAALAGLLLWRAQSRAKGAPQYLTAPVERGDLEVTVTATGTLSALDTVEVSSEVSGRVAEVRVDFNDRVRKGQVLAELDPEQAQARAQEAAAQVEAANAGLTRARATAEEARRKLDRAQELTAAGLLSKDEHDTAQATARRAEADVGSAAAQTTVARASLDDARSALRKTTIASPIDGIVLSRSVEPGQTVAASFQAPVLFTLARDLTQMKLVVAVDEADVGKVRERQPATFTVDAYPGRTFPSRVESLRNVAKTDQNVVTYEAVLLVDNQRREPTASGDVVERAPVSGRPRNNDDLALRPGMTATATVVTEEKRGVLMVPNAALRFTPPDVLAQENGARGGLFIPGVTRGSPFGRGGRQGQGQGQRAGAGGGAGAPGGASGSPPRGGAGGGAPGGGGLAGGDRGGFAGGAGGPGGSRSGGARVGGTGGQGGFAGRGGFGEGGGTRVWVLRAGKPEAVWVRTGATDGRSTEVVGDSLRPGDELIVDLAITVEARR